MDFREIEKRVNTIRSKAMNFKVYPSKKDYDDYLDRELIKELKLCIKKGISLEMTEKDYSKVLTIYNRLYKNNDGFLDNLEKISNKKVDYKKILDEMK